MLTGISLGQDLHEHGHEHGHGHGHGSGHELATAISPHGDFHGETCVLAYVCRWPAFRMQERR
jgi:hypothetical protein